MSTARDGRSAPASGKFLPLTFRQAALNQATAGAHGKTRIGEANPAAFTAETSTLSSADSTGLFAEALSAEARTQQPSNQASASNLGLQGLRADSTLANLPKAVTAEAAANPAPPMSSPYVAGTDAWLQDLGTRVEWLKDQDMNTAELQLHPAELGSLEIHISTVDDATTVSFVTHNAAAREIIEESLPRLRELFASQGMQLGESNVSQQSADGQRGQDGATQRGAGQNDAESNDTTPARRSAYLADPNRIDHYV
jgi:flagellar hook-length control protein FliK